MGDEEFTSLPSELPSLLGETDALEQEVREL